MTRLWRILLVGTALFLGLSIGSMLDPDACRRAHLGHWRPYVAPAPAPGLAPPGLRKAPAARKVSDVQLLAELALAEDPKAGAAVMWTVVNRARASRRPLLHVVTAPGQYGTRKGGRWIPSWWPERSWTARADLQALRGLRETARDVLAGDLPDPTGGATHFHRDGTWTPPWAPDPVDWTTLGSHHFYSPAKPPKKTAGQI